MSITIWDEIEAFDKRIMEEKQNLKTLMKERKGLYTKLYTENYTDTNEEAV